MKGLEKTSGTVRRVFGAVVLFPIVFVVCMIKNSWIGVGLLCILNEFGGKAIDRHAAISRLSDRGLNSGPVNPIG